MSENIQKPKKEMLNYINVFTVNKITYKRIIDHYEQYKKTEISVENTVGIIPVIWFLKKFIKK